MNRLNPFNTGSPADPGEFFGRANILDEIFKFLANRNQNTFLINGIRRIGKTSLLRKIQHEIPSKGYLPVYFDLQDKGELTLPEILYELMQTINLELETADNFKLQDFKKNYDIFEKEYLKGILLRKPNIVLLFDEFDVLGDRKFIAEDEKTRNLAYVKFVPYLRKLIGKKMPLKFIFAIGRSPGDLAEYYGPIKKSSQVVELSYFEYSESEELINNLTADTISYPVKAIQKIHQITNGFPYLLQCLSGFLFDKAEDNNNETVNPDEIDQYIIPAVRKNSGGLSWFWEGFKPEERVYLFTIAHLTENQTGANEKSIKEKLKSFKIATFAPQYANVLSKLLKSKIINEASKSGNYKIVVPFIQKWIITEHTIESLKADVRSVDKITQQHLDLGINLRDEKDYEEAIDQFKKVLKRDPVNYEAQYNLAFCLNAMPNGNESEIIEAFRKAYDMDPVQAKEPYFSILCKFYEKNKNEDYLGEILGMSKADKSKLEKLLNYFFEKWQNEFGHNRVNHCISDLDSNKWIVENFKTDVEDFLRENMEKFLEKRKSGLVIELYDWIYGKLDLQIFYKFYSKATELQYGKLIEEGRKNIKRERKQEMKIERKRV